MCTANHLSDKQADWTEFKQINIGRVDKWMASWPIQKLLVMKWVGL